MKGFFRSTTKLPDFADDFEEPDCFQQLCSTSWTLSMNADYIPMESDTDLNDFKSRVAQLISTAKRLNDIIKIVSK